jgi:uncharacterized membrane protein
MLESTYRKRLEKDLPDWEKSGWVTSEGAAAILMSAGTTPSKARLPIIIGFLGAILIAASVMTVIAANWDGIPRIWKLALLLSAMAVSYLAAWRFSRADHEGFADIALLIGTAVFGGAIMLVGQIYHIGNHFPDGILVWAIGALAAALLTSSRSALLISLAAALYWSGIEMLELNWQLHWPFLVFWLASAALVALWKWEIGYRIVTLAIMAWLAIIVFKYADAADWNALNFGAVVMLFMAALFSASHLMSLASAPKDNVDKWLGFGLSARPWALVFLLGGTVSFRFMTVIDTVHPLEGTIWTVWLGGSLVLAGIATALTGFAIVKHKLSIVDGAAILGAAALPLVFAIIANTDPGIIEALWAGLVSAAVAIGICVWAMNYGQEHHYPKAVNLGFLAFGFEVLYIYFETFGTLLDTAIFLAIGGLVLLALAWFLNRLRKRFVEPAGSAGS